MPERVTPPQNSGGRSEGSAEAVVAVDQRRPEPLECVIRGPGRAKRRREGPNDGEGKPTVSLGKPTHQKAAQAALPAKGRGEAPSVCRSGAGPTANRGDGGPGTDRLMERVVEANNLRAALARVRQNKGSPGIDGMTVDELPEHLRTEWPQIREELLAGTYRPKPVRRQEIPKSGGGVRELGIPCVLDRFVQQAILNVLQPIFDPTFSEFSYGFRPGRSAHQAVLAAQRYIQAGKRVVVDVDLEKFFDRVNHDVLMGRLAKRIDDKRMLRLIRRYLEAGIMANGVVIERHEGTPQGGPLSPLLANVLLDEVDKELEKRGLSFARYADDLNVYVGSKRAGDDAMQTLRRLYAKLKLRVNEAKSAVGSPLDRKFLGYSFWVAKGGKVKLRVAPKALTTMKERVRQITSRITGRRIDAVIAELRGYLLGWKGYFRLAETPKALRVLDEWIRHRLRALQLKHWKRGRTAYRELRRLGAPEDVAARVARFTRRWWKNSGMLLNSVLTTRYYDERGLPRLGG